MTESTPSCPPSTPPVRAASWLSEGVEHLFADLQANQARPYTDVDVLVIGSGYGGAMAAATLAGALHPDGTAVTLCVLERGREYLPGAFPSRMGELPGHLRFSTARGGPAGGNREGLFDLRIGPDCSALVANGLGGGSLINAGVMATPSEEQLSSVPIPYTTLAPLFESAGRLLGARVGKQDNTILAHRDGAPAKFKALQSIGAAVQGEVRAAPVTIAMEAKQNDAGIALDACIGCGDCASGCNYNAKDSLDTNLLVKAWRQGAKLYTGATVLRFSFEAAPHPKDGRWCVEVVFTDATLRTRHKHPFKLYCSKLILAAGTFGSSEILLRSRSDTLAFSPLLGQKFSSNGDMIMAIYDQGIPVNAVADEDSPPRERKIGPTITGMLQTKTILVEEMAVPGALRHLFGEVVTTAHTLHSLGAADASEHVADPGLPDPCSIDAAALGRSSVVAMMGDDGAEGSLELTGHGGAADGDGAIRVRWPGLRHAQIFKDQLALLHGYARASTTARPVILPNPMWKLLPADLDYLLSEQHGPPMTVHPLGGCPMGPDVEHGVVNRLGQVFRVIPGAGPDTTVFDGLVVLDGAIIGQALGVNPALTIATIALYASEELRKKWGWRAPPAQAGREQRPVFRIMPTPDPATVKRTAVEFVERMAGVAGLIDAAGQKRDCMVELTMPFKPVALHRLVPRRPGDDGALGRTLTLDSAARVRVYDRAAWDKWKVDRDMTAQERPPPLLSAHLSGTLAFFHREPSRRWQRTWRAFLPWLRNRGLRDTWQWAEERIREGGFFSRKPGGTGPLQDVRRRWSAALALASRAGEVRLFDYTLAIGEVEQADAGFQADGFEGQRIQGRKRLTYGRASNPWKQLTTMALETFPGLAPGTTPMLELDTGFLVNQDIPLLRIRRQQDQPNALVDVAALGGYLLRLLLSVHIWSFRKPDAPLQRAAQRLPGSVPGLPEPRIRELEVGVQADGLPVFVRLTRYRRDDMPASLAPVMMIHGYSASGTSFAHPLVDPNLASHLWKKGHDVWIVDLRTSSGMPTARQPWNFEDAAHADIPAAVDHIWRETGERPIDVVAHCMGGAMFGMAVLGEPEPGARFFRERQALPDRINRVVLSQVGPLVVFSQSNIFRAYLMGYLNRVLPMEGYTFRVEGEPTLADELLDRALATLPYPEHEFPIENPVWPWRYARYSGTRRRMDALYGRDFSLENLNRAVLDNIDDFFGPLSIDTVSQAIHLARRKTICNRAGRNVYVSRRKLKARWKFETLCVHGRDNGLSDVATLGRMCAIFADAQVEKHLHVQAFDGFGHQDCLIGRNAIVVHETIGAFLAGERPLPEPTPPPAAQADNPLLARIPHSGPMRAGFAQPDEQGIWCSKIGCGTTPVMPDALLVVCVPVAEQGGRFQMAGTPVPGRLFPQETELYAALADDNGYVSLSHRPAPAGAAGMLPLIVYDASPLMGHQLTQSDLLKNARLRGMDLFRLAARASAPASMPLPDMPPLDLRFLIQKVVELVEEIEKFIHDAVERELREVPAEQLKKVLLPVGTHDVAPQSGQTGAASNAVCFALASCQYPAGMLDRGPAFASYARLAALLDTPSGAQPDQPVPEFLVLMGDQIYADATAGLFDPTDLDDRYVLPYEKLLSNDAVRAVFRRLPVFAMLDDHEISDNWERGVDPLAHDANLEAGRRAYLTYQRNASPDMPQLWSAKVVNGIHLFMADTRSERDARTVATVGKADIMCAVQWRALEAWLREQAENEPAGKPRFLVTPSLLAPRRLGVSAARGSAGSLRADTWDGYPAARDRLLSLVAEIGLSNLVLLSGDEHVSMESTLTLTRPGRAPIEVRSIHSSALYAPYPFANAIPADFAGDDAFDVDDPRAPGTTIGCAVSTRFYPGDGFAVLTVTSPGENDWTFGCTFVRASGDGPDSF